MRSIVVISFLFICLLQSNKLRAQDAIVTIHGDTIFSKVLEKNDMFIYYYNPEKRKGERKVISRKEVAEIIPNFYDVDENHFKYVQKSSFDRFFISGKGGYSRLLAPTLSFEALEEEYNVGLLGGLWYSVEAGMMIRDNFGVSLVAARAQHSNEVRIIDNVSGRQGILADDITIDYYGVNAVMLFAQSQSGSQFSIHLGFGVNRYQNDFELFFPFRLSGYALGVQATGAYEWSLGPGLRIPIYVGFRGFQIVNLDVQAMENTQDPFAEEIKQTIESGAPFDLRRIELGAGLIISF